MLVRVVETAGRNLNGGGGGVEQKIFAIKVFFENLQRGDT